jgi:DNA polymerase-3 subunit gamma/tau
MESGDYQVLARKYRPGTFAELIGQEAMVRTLTNAIESGRLAHAFVLTGVRGVGKTTTARLIARALNCYGKDGQGSITVSPCGACESCKAIAESRHVDVMEMDAASRTGVDDIREIIESVCYAPASARFKIYIIDEVHMLSKNAFNALLKTLEEPPPHVKFIFATTEIRKLPVTVLSRCQRFDLRRVDSELLIKHFAGIVKKEGAEVEAGALRMIARAAEGSVRDGLSLLDQAIAHGGGKASAEEVRAMLGLADRAKVLDLFRHLMAGQPKEALALFREQYDLGADPSAILRDLAEVVHWLTRLRVAPEAGTDALISQAQLQEGRDMADKLKMPELTRTWQLLLKGIQETQSAPQPVTAAEMVLIRLAFAANLPSPAEIAQNLEKQVSAGDTGLPVKAAEPSDEPEEQAVAGQATAAPQGEPHSPTGETNQPTTAVGGSGVLALDQSDNPASVEEPMPISFEALVEMFERRREGVLGHYLRDAVEVVSFKPGVVVVHPIGRIPPQLGSRMRLCLEEWTGNPWQIAIDTRTKGDGTLRQADEARQADLFKEAAQNPLVAAALKAFPSARISEVIDLEGGADNKGEAGHETNDDQGD